MKKRRRRLPPASRSSFPAWAWAAAGVAAVAVLGCLALLASKRSTDARLRGMEERSRQRQVEAFRQADVERRFKEDPAFRDRMVREAVEEERRRGRRVQEPRLKDYTE